MTQTETFETFWQAYPKRNGKKVGRYPCSLWFEAKKPSPETVQLMVQWLETDKANRRASTGKRFYGGLPDPIRFLKYKMWEDDIGPLVKKQASRLCECGRQGVATIRNRWHCGSDGPCAARLRAWQGVMEG